MTHRPANQLSREIAAASRQIVLRGCYVHYKQPDRFYTVIGFGVDEATDQICVLYQANYAEQLIFVRPVSSWLEQVEQNGTKISRFSLVADQEITG